MYSRSEIFTIYNKAKAAARAGALEAKRVDRALGILISGRERPYLTTTRSCSCADAAFGNRCKHQIAAMIKVRMDEARAEADQVIFSYDLLRSLDDALKY